MSLILSRIKFICMNISFVFHEKSYSSQKHQIGKKDVLLFSVGGSLKDLKYSFLPVANMTYIPSAKCVNFGPHNN